MKNYENFTRGDIRKQADDLLGMLSAAYLRNIGDDNREEIKQRIDDINNSGIDLNKDVVKSIRDKYKYLIGSLDTHMNRW